MAVGSVGKYLSPMKIGIASLSSPFIPSTYHIYCHREDAPYTQILTLNIFTPSYMASTMLNLLDASSPLISTITL